RAARATIYAAAHPERKRTAHNTRAHGADRARETRPAGIACRQFLPGSLGPHDQGEGAGSGKGREQGETGSRKAPGRHARTGDRKSVADALGLSVAGFEKWTRGL